MRSLRLLGTSVIALLAFGVIPASGAFAKSALVLKEAHVPVPVGAEVTVDLETGWTTCEMFHEGPPPGYKPEPMSFHGQVAVNGARTDLMTLTTEERTCANAGTYSHWVYGSLKEISLAVSGQYDKAKIHASLVMGQPRHANFSACVYDVNAFGGRFPVPGYARIEGVARGALDVARTYEGEGGKCHKTAAVHFKAAVYGHNGELLETERIS
jgi:hypothetical protein